MIYEIISEIDGHVDKFEELLTSLDSEMKDGFC